MDISTLRIARHTQDLAQIVAFYRDIIGLQIVGSFSDHADYGGVFLAGTSAGWHLEFTTSPDLPDHKPDPDDLLVFYVNGHKELGEFKARFDEGGITIEVAKNPYWKNHGILVKDPDGFGVVIAIRPQ